MDEEYSEELAGVTVERSVELPTQADEVWEHLVDGVLLGEWMGGRVEIDARPGGPITLSPKTGREVWGTVEEVVPGRRIQWSWRSDEGLPSLVEWSGGRVGGPMPRRRWWQSKHRRGH